MEDVNLRQPEKETAEWGLVFFESGIRQSEYQVILDNSSSTLQVEHQVFLPHSPFIECDCACK